MFENSIITLFLSGLGLGLLHAFDSDHLLAVSNLIVQKQSYKKALGYSLHWAIGHGLVLILIGLYASFLGLNIPLILSHWAEYLVGIMLIGLGSWTLYILYTELEFNAKNEITNHQQVVKRSPLLVGVVHGTAGSAPILALIPAIQLQQPVITLSYMLFFAFGVLLSMSVFAIAFSQSHRQMAKHNLKGFRFFRLLLGILAIGLGCFWLV